MDPNLPLPHQSPETIKRLAHELHEFRQTALYQLYRAHYADLYDLTVRQIINERLEGVQTLFSREAWIGEARTADLNYNWFETAHSDIDDIMKTLDK
jgi:hypothetical protein